VSHDEAVTTIFSVITVAVTIIALARIWVGRHKAPAAGAGAGALENRLARVEVALDDVTAELGRMTESHQFLVKALADRATQRELTGGAPR
jgi:hypothetical protein